MRVQLLANTSTATYPLVLATCSWVGWSSVREVSCSTEARLIVLQLPHIPNCTAGSTGAIFNVGKARFLLKETSNNNKQHHLGIEPGSSGSQANPKPLHATAPHKINLSELLQL